MLFPPDGRWRPRLTYFRFAAAGALVGLAVMLSTGVAGAFPEFPEEIQEVLGLDCTPVCILCHLTPEGGKGTATRPFSSYMIGKGLLTDRAAAFAAAAQDPAADVDEDGINDVVEIKQNTNPNVKDLPDKPSDPICADAVYGCGARIAPTRGSAPADKGWGLLAALGVAMLLFRQRRRSA